MRFYDFHPLTLIIYFSSVVALTMVTMNPIMLVLSFLGALSAVKIITEKTSFKSYVLLFVVIAVTNPVFSHNGVTVLFYLFDQRITLESFFYGIGAGVLILAVLYWFKLFGCVFTEDKLTWLIGKISPKLCVVFCMALRFVPTFRENAKDIYNAQLSMGIFNTDTLKGKLSLCVNVLSALLSLSIENAIETADIMTSRGFNSKKRSSFSLVLFSKKDIIFTVVTLAADFVSVFFLLKGEGTFYYYPEVRFYGFSPLYPVFAIICVLPVLNDITEEIKWKYLISKI